jgi:hypothetical protein
MQPQIFNFQKSAGAGSNEPWNTTHIIMLRDILHMSVYSVSSRRKYFPIFRKMRFVANFNSIGVIIHFVLCMTQISDGYSICRLKSMFPPKSDRYSRPDILYIRAYTHIYHVVHMIRISS